MVFNYYIYVCILNYYFLYTINKKIEVISYDGYDEKNGAGFL